MDFHNFKILSFDQGCQYMGFAKSYVYKLTSAGVIPHSKPNGKKIFFEKEKLDEWLLSNAIINRGENLPSTRRHKKALSSKKEVSNG